VLQEKTRSSKQFTLTREPVFLAYREILKFLDNATYDIALISNLGRLLKTLIDNEDLLSEKLQEILSHAASMLCRTAPQPLIIPKDRLVELISKECVLLQKGFDSKFPQDAFDALGFCTVLFIELSTD